METELWAAWPSGQERLRDLCRRLAAAAAKAAGRELESVVRPGVSHSFRGVLPEGGERPVWMLLDVILSEHEPWWLSVCFYADTIDDPEERGEVIPGGLLGEDGYCFDVVEAEAGVLEYLTRRIEEAYAATSGR